MFTKSGIRDYVVDGTNIQNLVAIGSGVSAPQIRDTVNRQFGVNKLLRVVFGDPLCTGHVILRMRSELCSLHNGITAIFAYNMAYSSS